MRAGDQVEGDVATLSRDGAGIIAVAGRELHVLGAFPGERVRCRVTHVDRQGPRAWGDVVSLLRPDPHRRRPPCPSHRANRGAAGCDGCLWQPLSLSRQAELHHGRLLDLGVVVDRVVGGGDDQAGEGYRMSAKRLVATGRDGALRLGSRPRAAHGIADMWGCRVDHPVLTQTFDDLAAAARVLGVRTTGPGALRAVWGVTNGAAAHVTLVVAPEADGGMDAAPWAALAATLPAVAGWSMARAGEGNGLRGAEATPIAGTQELRIEVRVDDDEPLTFVAAAHAFLQPNVVVASQAWRDVCGPPPGDDGGWGRALASGPVLDLYAGTGATTALLRRRGARVTAVEAAPEAARALETPAGSVEVALAAWSGGTPALVVANPPRTGMSAAVVEALLRLRPRYLQVMSCHPWTLARDLAILHPTFVVRGARAYLTLPHTPHVEVVVWLEQREHGGAEAT